MVEHSLSEDRHYFCLSPLLVQLSHMTQISSYTQPCGKTLISITRKQSWASSPKRAQTVSLSPGLQKAKVLTRLSSDRFPNVADLILKQNGSNTRQYRANQPIDVQTNRIQRHMRQSIEPLTTVTKHSQPNEWSKKDHFKQHTNLSLPLIDQNKSLTSNAQPNVNVNIALSVS